MTADPVADLASVLDPAFADFDATDVLDTTAVRAATGWVPEVPVVGYTWGANPPPAPLPQVVLDMAEGMNWQEEAADERSRAVWARTKKKEIAAAKRKQAKEVAVLRAQYGHAVTAAAPDADPAPDTVEALAWVLVPAFGCDAKPPQDCGHCDCFGQNPALAMRAARAVLDSGLVVPRAEHDAARNRNAERAARLVIAATALAERDATIAWVQAECAKWERRASDGYPIEPRAIDYAKRLRRALDGGAA